MKKCFLAALAVIASLTPILGATAGRADPLFGAKTDFGTGPGPRSVAIGDLNRDGKPDLVTANYNSGTVSVLLNNGGGVFGAPTHLGTGGGASSVAIGGLNGDGSLDLAVANAHTNTVSVLLGNGDGTFAPKTDYATGDSPASVAIGDLNGDGSPDLAVANSGSNTVSVLLRNGNGAFGRTDYATGVYPASVAIGDLNWNGMPALVTANEGSGTVSVLSYWIGVSWVMTDFAAGGDPRSVAIGDLDGDGYPELAMANYSSGTVSVLRNNEVGFFGGEPLDCGTGGGASSVAIGDLNADGRLDLAVANAHTNTVSVLLGYGDGTFGRKMDFATGDSPASVAIGDLNGDGMPDLVTANEGSNTVSVLLNAGAPLTLTSTSLTSAPNPSVVGQAITLTATVTPRPSTGDVTFYDGATSLGTAPVTGGVATLAVSSLYWGLHSLTAVYSGDAVYIGSASAALLQTVNASRTPPAVVPDDFPTIQAGIDSWRDTVLVRGGHYDEDLVLNTGVTLAAIHSEAGGDTVETGGLSVRREEDVPGLPGRCLIDVRGFHFAKPVRLSLGNYYLALVACRFDSSLVVFQGYGPIDSCTILNGVRVSTDGQAILTNNRVFGGGIYVDADADYEIRGNYVQGPAEYGIRGQTEGGGHVVGNTVIGADVGVSVSGSCGPQVCNNTITGCSGTGIVCSPWGKVSGNRVTHCGGRGIDAPGHCRVERDTVVDCAAGGILALGPDVSYSQVLRCGGYGIEAGGSGQVSQNTIVSCAAAGILLHAGADVQRNIAYGNLGPGLKYEGSPTDGNLAVGCNDWFANSGGATSGIEPGESDVSVDPLFCDLAADDVHLLAASPLLDAVGCGLIGALGQGCVDSPTPALLSFVSAEVGVDGVKLTWLAGGSKGAVAAVYRSPVGGPWTRIGQVTVDGTGYLRYTDRDIPAATRIGYRLGIIAAGIESFYGETWVDLPAHEAPLTFALDPVRPNPARGGTLTVHFSLPTDVPARLDLLDVAGRRIASHEVGVGHHTLDLGHDQRLAPGLYLVRLTQGANTRTTRVAVLR